MAINMYPAEEEMTRAAEADISHAKPRITVIGVGGAGGNAVNNMIQSQLEGVEFVVANTDAQALEQSRAEQRIQLGVTVTRGLGAGSRPDVGRAAAEEALEDVLAQVHDSNMVFITAGMGGGTGTGAAPVIAKAVREQGVLTVGVVTKPFTFEGIHRQRIAETGIEELERVVDTLIIIPNQNLFRIANEKTTFADAFKMADDVLASGVRGVTDLMVRPSMINLDFNDISTVMSEMGKAMMGTGEAEGDTRALEAAAAAINNPLLEDISLSGATGVIINITGGTDLTLYEVDEAANHIRNEVDSEAHIIFGSTLDDELNGKIRVSIVATGMDTRAAKQAPVKRDSFLDPALPQGLPLAVEPAGEPEPRVVVMRPQPKVTRKLGEEVDESVEPAPAVTGKPQPADVGTAQPETATVREAGRPMPATPGVNQGDPFIPAMPAARGPDNTARKAEPMAEALEVTATPEPAKPEAKQTVRIKVPNLFTKVTKGMRSGDVAKSATKFFSEGEAPAVSGKEGGEQPAASKQENLGGLDPDDRLPGTEFDEKRLEIPSFLRRAAS